MFVIITANVLALRDVANECEPSAFGKIEYFRENNVPVFQLFGNDRIACVNSKRKFLE